MPRGDALPTVHNGVQLFVSSDPRSKSGYVAVKHVTD